MRESEEHHDWNTLQSCMFIAGLALSLFISMEILMMIEEKPRAWDFGTLPFTPAESVYSTSVPERKPHTRLIEPLPEGKSMDESMKSKY